MTTPPRAQDFSLINISEKAFWGRLKALSLSVFTSAERQGREVVLVHGRAGRIVRRHPQGVPRLRHQIQDREKVGSGVFFRVVRLDVVVDQDPVGRVVVVKIRDRRVRDPNPILDNETRNGATLVKMKYRLGPVRCQGKLK